MYQLMKNGVVLSYEDKLRYTKRLANGCDVLCSADEADGIVVNNEYIEPLREITIDEFDATLRLMEMENALNELGVETRE